MKDVIGLSSAQGSWRRVGAFPCLLNSDTQIGISSASLAFSDQTLGNTLGDLLALRSRSLYAKITVEILMVMPSCTIETGEEVGTLTWFTLLNY